MFGSATDETASFCSEQIPLTAFAKNRSTSKNEKKDDKKSESEDASSFKKIESQMGKPNIRNLANLARLTIKERQEASIRKLNTWVENNISMKEELSDDDDDDDVIETPTTCFGDVEFRGATRRSRAKFVRLSDETDPATVYELMTKGWKMEIPRLLISVIGGVESFNLDSVLKQNFLHGISKIAQTTGAWVISGGMNGGVMKHVGDALQGMSKSCIGIVPWGAINNRDQLMPVCDEVLGTTFYYDVGSWLTDTGVFLENNHTHFLLVDDGSKEDIGAEVVFRRKFEKYIMENITDRVPSVLLVIQGDHATLEEVVYEVTQENPYPVVLVKESGGVADLILYALSRRKEIEIQNNNLCLHTGLVHNINKYIPEVHGDEEQMKKAYQQISECLNSKDLFFIDHPQVAIDDAILTALLNDQNAHTFRQLQLTLLWNRADLARTEILATKLKWEGDPKELNWVMIMALAMDNVEFVKLLLEYGVSISSFLTNEVLEFLHGFRSYDKNSPLRYEISEKDYKLAHMSGINGNMYKTICSYNQIDTPYVAIPRKVVESVMQDICSGLVKIEDESFIEDLNLSKQDLSERLAFLNLGDHNLDSSLAIGFKYPFRELFFWAVLNNMDEMALFLWQFEEEHMAKALIAGEIFGELLNRRQNQEELEKSLQRSARIFQERSVQLLDECYKTDESKTLRLITSSFNQFPGLNNLNLAVNSNNLEFVAHTSVQVLLNDVWTGNMKMREVNLTQIILATFCPPLINKFDFRTEEESKVMAKTDDDVAELEQVQDEEEEEMKVAHFGDPFVKNDSGTQVPFYKKTIQFYLYTPVVKFVLYVTFYFLFLALFSYMAMLEKSSPVPYGLEYLLIVTVFAYLVAEVYQVIQMDAQSVKAKLNEWASSKVNLLDAFIIGLFFIALSFRLSPNYVKIGHLLYAIDCGLWILRLLNVFYVNPILGPYIVMITKMAQDLMIFICVMLISILAYGLITAAILHPSKDPTNIKMLTNPIWQPYFHIYGLMLFDRDAEPGKTRFGSDIHTKYDEPVVWCILAIYLLFTNILLLNLLIAVFNNTYNEVQTNASQIWKFERHSLIMEFSQRHALPPPLSLFGHFFVFACWLYSICVGKRKTEFSGLRSHNTQKEKDELIEFECNCVTQVSRRNNMGTKKTNEELTVDVLEHMETVKIAVASMEARLKQKKQMKQVKKEATNELKELQEQKEQKERTLSDGEHSVFKEDDDSSLIQLDA